jgi:DNA-binding Lrp family transcriptional regulator
MADSQEFAVLDQFDLKLLAALEADGRLTNAELAEKIGLSASQCSRRRIRLEETGIIEGYSARLNAARLGIGLLALVQVSLSPHSKENAKKFRDFVNGIYEIQEAFALTGDADYLLKVAAPDLSGLARIFDPAAGERLARQIVDRVDDAQGQLSPAAPRRQIRLVIRSARRSEAPRR